MVVAQRIVIGVAVQIDAATVRQRIFHDLRQHGAGTVGFRKILSARKITSSTSWVIMNAV